MAPSARYILAYDTGNLDAAANALSSKANFLKAHRWRAAAGNQPGEPNFAAIQAWNAAADCTSLIQRNRASGAFFNLRTEVRKASSARV